VVFFKAESVGPETSYKGNTECATERAPNSATGGEKVL